MKKVLIGAGVLAVVVGVLYLLFPVQAHDFWRVGPQRHSKRGCAGRYDTDRNESGLQEPDANVVALPSATTINPDFARLNLGSEAGTAATEANPDFKGAAHVARTRGTGRRGLAKLQPDADV